METRVGDGPLGRPSFPPAMVNLRRSPGMAGGLPRELIWLTSAEDVVLCDKGDYGGVAHISPGRAN